MKRILPTAIFSLALLGTVWTARAADEAATPDASAKTTGSFPSNWFYGDRPKEVVELEGKALPKVDLSKADWTGDKAPTDKELEGKILVIDVWATWCGPCRAALPHNAELAKEHAKDGVMVLGLCASGDAAQMKTLQDGAKVEYPTAFAEKIKDELDKALHIPWFPYYIVVDRKGVVRGAGLHHEGAAEAVKALLKEQPPVKTAAMLAEEGKVTLSGAHLCCSKCEKAVTKAVESVGAKVTIDKQVLTVAAADASTAQKAVDALVEAGFWATSDNAGVVAKDNSGVEAGAAKRLALTGVHNCCGKCEKAIVKAAKSVKGVKAAFIKSGNVLEVEGNFDGAEVVAALHAAGLHGKLKK